VQNAAVWDKPADCKILATTPHHGNAAATPGQMQEKGLTRHRSGPYFK
jgi:hypothetical protein